MIAGRALRVATAAALVSLTTGCVTLGKAGVLAFDYESRDRLLGRDGPDTAIAMGGHIDLNVYSNHVPMERPADDADGLAGVTREKTRFGLSPAEVLRALSSIPEVARVDAPAGPRVRVHGVSAGFADISVESALGGDTVTVSVAEVDAASVDHWFKDLLLEGHFPSDVAFVRGGIGRFSLSMRDVSGRSVVGAGVVPPITVEPPGAAVVAAIADGDMRHVELRFDRAGKLELRTRRNSPLPLLVVDTSAVKALELVTLDFDNGVSDAPPRSVRVGRATGVGVRGTLEDGRRVMLLGDVARVASSTPEVCATPPRMTEQARLVFGDGATIIDAVAPGACTLVATLGSLRAETTIQVEAKADKPAK